MANADKVQAVKDMFATDASPEGKLTRQQKIASVKQKYTNNDTIVNHFIGGIDRTTKALASVPESVFGTVQIGGEDGMFQYLTPKEAKAARDSNSMGLPGRALSDPDNILEKGAQVAGDTAVAGPILGKVMSTVGPAMGAGEAVIGGAAATGVLPKVQNLIHEAGQTFARHPILTTASETTMGYTAGMGGYAALEAYPDSFGAQFLGELAGGTGGGLALQMMPARYALMAGNWTYNKVTQPLTRAGSNKRAKDRMDRAIPMTNKSQIDAGLKQQTTIDPNTGEPVLSPATRTDNRGLMSLERSILNSTEELVNVRNERIARANEVIQESLSGIGGDIGNAQMTFDDAATYFQGLMTTRMEIATQRMDERISALGSLATKEEANRVGKEELNKLVADFDLQASHLWSYVPDDVQVPTAAVRAELSKHILEQGNTGAENIPPYAKKYLNPTVTRTVKGVKQEVPNPNYIGNMTSVSQIRIAQSKLKTIAANFKNSPIRPDHNKARIALDISTAIDLDLENAIAGPEASEVLAIAREFSAQFHNVIDKTVIGKITGRSAQGGERVAAGQTLSQSVGLPRESGRESVDAMFGAFDANQNISSERMIEATSNWFRSQFAEAATENGVVNAAKARSFFNTHEEALRRLPDLDAELRQVSQDGAQYSALQKRMGNIKLDDPRVSKATMFIQKGPVETFDSISKMQPTKAIREISNLINMASKDTTGEALSGLKAGAVQYLIRESKSQIEDADGLRFLSGVKMKDMLDNPALRGFKKLFYGEEMNRLKVIANDLSRLERARKAMPSSEGVLGDRPGKILNSIASVAGASAGRQWGRVTGSSGTVQIPGIFAQRFRELAASGVADPASRLLIDSVFDEELYREVLLAPITARNEVSQTASRRLQAWSASVLLENGGAFSEEEVNNQ